MNLILLYFAIKYYGDWDRIFKALEDKEKVALTDIRELEEEIKDQKWKFITILDSDYPNKLKEAYKPPFVIWYKGNLKLLDEHLICLSGEIKDDITKGRVEKFMPEVSKSNKVVVGYFENFGGLINDYTDEVLYVCAEGLDKIKHKYTDKDLLISEYPIGCSPKREHFGNRNRLIASFGDSLILFNSKTNSGINSLINAFLNQGKEIYCFPGDGTENDGNSELIKNGANLITSIKDISK